MDSALSEYAFDRDFFHAEDTTLFTEIFSGVCKYVRLRRVHNHIVPDADERVGGEHDGLRGRADHDDADPEHADGERGGRA